MPVFSGFSLWTAYRKRPPGSTCGRLAGLAPIQGVGGRAGSEIDPAPIRAARVAHTSDFRVGEARSYPRDEIPCQTPKLARFFYFGVFSHRILPLSDCPSTTVPSMNTESHCNRWHCDMR